MKANSVYPMYLNDRILFLNYTLIKKQKIQSNLSKLKIVYQTKYDIYENIKSETNPTILKSYAEDLTLCEYELQKLWKLPLDIKFHRYWETPKCTCPKIDNQDQYPHGYYLTQINCPLHGLV